jgi:very-short-patch-repair endonuclease
VVARRQLQRLGLNHKAIWRRVDAGMLHPLHGTWVFAVGRNPLTRQGRYLAAVMACGPAAKLSHRAGGDLQRIRPADARPEVTVPEVSRRVPGVIVHRTRMLDPQDFTVVDSVPVTSVARTLLDLAGTLRPPDLEVVIDRAERLRLLDLTDVVDVLKRANGRKGADTLRRLVQAYELSNQRSKLERAFKRLLKTAPDIRTPFFNALVDGERRTNEVDALWETERLAVQLDGFEWHHTRRDRETDAISDADLELVGYRVMRLTWDDATVNGERTLRRIRLALGVS